ncbi:MAG: FKBP-type peptidyl-prolyl cis-trans isomerase [Planctomycetota bacterium]|jgi:FKBP-type peptidyl-prolyl cis-trans isomerase FklB|nr:FKBP-type peptidyl-prolyl cis-trans isomerase [Planctomycetaceae bacterium]
MQVLHINRVQGRLVRATLLGALAMFVVPFASQVVRAQDAPKVIVPSPVVPSQGDTGLKDPKSYAIGFQIGKDISSSGLSAEDLELKELLEGFTDGLTGKSKLNDQQMQQAMASLQEQMKAKMIQKSRKNLERANDFLKTNKDKEGVQTTKSGLQYQAIKSGSGKTPALTSTVKVHYEGKLLDGKVFDSSIARGEPIEFPVNGVIPGWTEALQRMKVGDKWKLFIPPGLAYGERGAGSDIGPNELLVFEVELLDVK